MPKMEAVLDPSGSIVFTKPFRVTSPTRILVTVLPEGLDAETYEEAMRYFASPEAQEQREKAMADYRAGRWHTTAEAIDYFNSLIRSAEQS